MFNREKNINRFPALTAGLELLTHIIALQGPILVLVFIGATLCIATISKSDDFTDLRITAGAKIFRALLAADMDIEDKIGKNGTLTLCLLYRDDNRNAREAAGVLQNRRITRIRNLDARVETLPFASWMDGKKMRTAAIFLTQPLSDENLRQLLERSGNEHIVVFSPFEGDVERGVQGGISVESRVRPYLNLKSLNRAGIRLKSFFLRVSKHYDQQ